MNIKTVTTIDGVNTVDFGSAASRFYWIENLGSTTVYVSVNENIVPDGDNVKVLSAGCSTMVENLGGKVYILGAGKFQITNQGDKFPPFRNAPVASSGGGVKECAAAGFSGVGIITDIIVENEHEVEVTFDYEEYDNLETIFSSTQDVTNAPHLTTYANQYYVGMGTSEKAFGTTTTGKHTFIRNRNGKCIFDGEEISGLTLVDYPGAGTYYYTLGCRGTKTYPLKGKIYSFIIRSNSTGEVLHNFIPVVCVGTSFGAMYDTITNKSYNVSNAITAEVD